MRSSPILFGLLFCLIGTAPVSQAQPTLSMGGVSGAGGGGLVAMHLEEVGLAILARFPEVYSNCFTQERLQQVLGSQFFQLQIAIPSQQQFQETLSQVLSHLDVEALNQNPVCGVRGGQLQSPDVCTIPAQLRGGRALIQWNLSSFPTERRDVRKLATHELLRAIGLGSLEDFPGNTSTHFLMSECVAEVLGSTVSNGATTTQPAIQDSTSLYMHNIGVDSAIIPRTDCTIPAAMERITIDIPARDLVPSAQISAYLGIPYQFAQFVDQSCGGSALRCSLKARWATPWTRVLPANIGLRVTQALSSDRDHWGMVAFGESPNFENLICNFEVRHCPHDSFFYFLGRNVPNIQDLLIGLQRLNLNYFPAAPRSVRK